jgi:type I restriction enzyme S subunit
MREMKDSGVEWIGEIPKGWTLSSVKREYRFQTGWTPSTEKDEYFEGEHIWVNISDMRGRIIYDSAKHINDEATRISSMSISPTGSLLFAFKLSIGNVAFAGRDLYTNEAIATFLLGQNSLNFLYYAAPIFITENANENIYGAKLLNQQLISNARILIPPIDIQHRIANYLDDKCAQIDRAIARQQEVIEKLKEYKLSVITEAVTKGLNPDAPMKDSGIEWIGEIPKGWKTIRVKWLLVERKDRSNDGLEEPLSMSQKFGLIPTREMDMVPNMASSFIGAKLVCENDLVFNKLKAHLGVFSVSKYQGLVSPDYAVYYASGRADLKYLEYLFKTPQCIWEFRKNSSGIADGLTRLYTDGLYSIECPLPDKEEQLEIARVLNEKCACIEATTLRKQDVIGKLTEYKKSLIYEVVTGKREV